MRVKAEAVKTEINVKFNGTDAKVVATTNKYVWLICDGGSIELSKILRKYTGSRQSLRMSLERVWSELEEFWSQRQTEAHHSVTLLLAA
jgi:hypothetical protein